MYDPGQLKDHAKEDRLILSRFVVAGILVLLLAMVLVARLFYLQVVLQAELATKSDENRIHLQPIAPNRGLIYDRNGKILAENLPVYNLTITRERTKNIDSTLQFLKPILQLNEEDISNFKKRLNAHRAIDPVTLKYELNQKEIAQIAVNKYKLPEVDIEAQLVRHYPYGKLFAHSIGYVGRINDRELRKLNPKYYAGMDTIGKLGIEGYYEQQLLGKPGYREVETTAGGRPVRTIKQVSPIAGKNLKLNLDVRLQQIAFKALGKQRGAVVALDPQTGGVLAMVSTPAFDPNLFVTGISRKNYGLLRNNVDLPLYNRASMGEYPPASAIKPMMGFSALDSGAIDLKTLVFDPGYFRLPGEAHKYRNWKHSGHGWVNLNRAIVVSNDTFFYNAAVSMGIDTIDKYLTEVFSFGQRTGLDIGEERPGLVPSPAWKKGAQNTVWYPGETVITGIGQGFLLATPMQMAVATAVIANHGTKTVPKLVQEKTTVDSEKSKAQNNSKIMGKSWEWKAIIEAMRQVVANRHGTAYRTIGRHLKAYQMAGKTGTAQVVGIAQDERYDAEQIAERHRDHSWFVGFAPVKKPKIVVAVIVENGAEAKEYSAPPIAKKVIDAWLLGSENGSTKVQAAAK